MKCDRTVSIDALKSVLKRFRNKRDWVKFHDPKNLAEAITIEASELLELFLWKGPVEIERMMKADKAYRREIENELADVFCFSFNLANALDLDVATIVQRKIRENGKRYPVQKSRGTAAKYSKL
jgi:NTP pyrophosphatase (non-canonical NTP hydrolase)